MGPDGKLSKFIVDSGKTEFPGTNRRLAVLKTVWHNYRMRNFQSPDFPHNFAKKQNLARTQIWAVSTRLDVSYNLL